MKEQLQTDVLLFQEAINCFIQQGREIEGVIDLLIRGSGAQENCNYVENWSDLDLSIIVSGINTNVLIQYRAVYKAIKSVFPYKVSITLVTYKDFLSQYHHHGIKPIYYNRLLERAVSILKKTSPSKELTSLGQQKIDCVANISYLIHDLKSRWLTLDDRSYVEVRDFFYHVVKRSKHIVRNIIFVMRGIIDEEIDVTTYANLFPGQRTLLPVLLKNYKYAAISIRTQKKDTEELIKDILCILEGLEPLHIQLIDFVNKEGPSV